MVKNIYEVHYFNDATNEELKRFDKKKDAMAFAKNQATLSRNVEVLLQEVEYENGEIVDFGDFRFLEEWIDGKRVKNNEV